MKCLGTTQLDRTKEFPRTQWVSKADLQFWQAPSSQSKKLSSVLVTAIWNLLFNVRSLECSRTGLSELLGTPYNKGLCPGHLVLLFQISGRSPQDWWHCGAGVFWPGDHLLQWHRGLHHHFSPQWTHRSSWPSEWSLHIIWCRDWKPWRLQGEEYLGMRIKLCLGQTLLTFYSTALSNIFQFMYLFINATVFARWRQLVMPTWLPQGSQNAMETSTRLR